MLGIQQYYKHNLTAVNPGSDQIGQFTVTSGESAKDIGERLEEEQFIRASWAFAWYMRSEGLSEAVRVGTYQISPNMKVPEIASIITGDESVTDTITIFPERRLDQIRASLIEQGDFEPSEVDAALESEQYHNHPALKDKPADASLEGYLYPETFHVDSDTTVEDIVNMSLDQMATRLSPRMREAIRSQGVSVHEGIILASVVEREVASHNPEDRPQVAQVFYSRLNDDIALESNATAPYGAVLAGLDPDEHPNYNSLYNTYRHAGLPPTPISNVSISALEAVAQPAETDYLYFVSGDDCLEPGGTCTNHFSRTLEEHEENILRYCPERCSPGSQQG